MSLYLSTYLDLVGPIINNHKFPQILVKFAIIFKLSLNTNKTLTPLEFLFLSSLFSSSSSLIPISSTDDIPNLQFSLSLSTYMPFSLHPIFILWISSNSDDGEVNSFYLWISSTISDGCYCSSCYWKVPREFLVLEKSFYKPFFTNSALESWIAFYFIASILGS